MIAIIRQHRILLPSRVSLLIKMLVMLEGTSQQLNPDFNHRRTAGAVPGRGDQASAVA